MVNKGVVSSSNTMATIWIGAAFSLPGLLPDKCQNNDVPAREKAMSDIKPAINI